MIPIRKRSNRHPCYRCGIMMGYGRKIIQVSRLKICDYCAPIIIEQMNKKLKEAESE